MVLRKGLSRCFFMSALPIVISMPGIILIRGCSHIFVSIFIFRNHSNHCVISIVKLRSFYNVFIRHNHFCQLYSIGTSVLFEKKFLRLR